MVNSMPEQATHAVALSRPKPRPSSHRQWLWLVALLGFACVSSLLMGRFPIRPADAMQVVAGAIGLPARAVSPQVETIVLCVRLPRILAAVFVGVALSLSGASFQGLFRNAVVSPDLLGASSGAGFGASLAILFSFGLVPIQVAAFVGGILAVIVSYGISRSLGRGSLALVLSGVAVSALFSALTSMTKLVADPVNKLPAITFWLMGGLSNVTIREARLLMATTVIGATPLILLRWRLNIVALGDEHAVALGMRPHRTRLLIVACATLLTASSVAVCGMVGWVGLLVPNIARSLVGPAFDRLLPAAALLGAVFVLVVDTICRTLYRTEVPLGIVCSLLGAPFLLVMLARREASAS